MQPDLPEWASAISFPGDLICHPFLERHCTSILFGCQAEVTTKRRAQFMIRIPASTHQDDDTRQPPTTCQTFTEHLASLSADAAISPSWSSGISNVRCNERSSANSAKTFWWSDLSSPSGLPQSPARVFHQEAKPGQMLTIHSMRGDRSNALAYGTARKITPRE